MEVTTLAVEVVNGNPAERILVIAPSYDRFHAWCLDHDISRHSRNVRCITRGDDLRGYRGAWYVFLGVPDGIEGQHMGRMFEHWKALGALKNAYVAERGDGPEET